MFCGNCGAEVNESVKFCARCGAPIERTTETENSDTSTKTMGMFSQEPNYGTVCRPEQGPGGAAGIYVQDEPKKNNLFLLNLILGVVAAVLAVVVIMAGIYLKTVKENTQHTYRLASVSEMDTDSEKT